MSALDLHLAVGEVDRLGLQMQVLLGERADLRAGDPVGGPPADVAREPRPPRRGRGRQDGRGGTRWPFGANDLSPTGTVHGVR